MTLDDGHPVSVAIAGRGLPFVVAHGFSAQGILYAQTLSRLVTMGFKVVAIDTPGHGRTRLPRKAPFDLRAHAHLLARAIDHLGIRQAVLLGHSLGGRMVAEVADRDPARVVALILVDAIVGRPWDLLMRRLRTCPPVAVPLLTRLAVDVAMTVPVMGDPAQSVKLASLAVRNRWGAHPMRLAGPGLAILLADGSAPLLDRLGRRGVRSIVVHGEYDLTVPLETGRDAARRLGGDLAVIRGAGHTWLLRDPEMLPSVLGGLLSGSLGEAWTAALRRAELDPLVATFAEIEAALYDEGALALALTPPLQFTRSAERRRRPGYTWAVERNASTAVQGNGTPGARPHRRTRGR